MKLQQRVIILLIILTTCVGIDQYTKKIAEEVLKNQPPQSFLGDMFRLEFAYNKGAFLSLFANLDDGMRFWLLTVATGFILAGVLLYLLFSKVIPRLEFVGYTLLFSGGVGNLIDRIASDQGVVDFLNMGIGGLRTGIFNVADMAIMGGIFLVLGLHFSQASQAKKEAAAASKSPQREGDAAADQLPEKLTH